MPKESKNISKIANTPLEDFIHVGDKWIEDEKILYTAYDSGYFQKKKVDLLNDCFDSNAGLVEWIDIVGLHNTSIIEEIAEKLSLHPLLIEDVLNTAQHPKVEYYDQDLFIVSKSIYIDKKTDEITTEQISFVLVGNTLVSFREFDSPVFRLVIDRIKENPHIRKSKADYLLYALIDAVVDDYFLIIEYIGDRIDIIEDELLLNPEKELLQKIYTVKRDLIYIRNTLWPMRRVINAISRNENDLVQEKTVYYFRDVYDHIVQIIDIVETYREICSGMLDTYLSNIGNKTNEVMKVLTIFSTIFIPLTFVAGVYGMNFRYFPELDWKYSYPLFWLLSSLVIGFMIRFFKKKKWI